MEVTGPKIEDGLVGGNFGQPWEKLKELAERVSAMENKDGSTNGSMDIKANIDWLKKEVASLMSMDISSLWDLLDMPLRVDINVVPEGITVVDVPRREDNERDDTLPTPNTNEETLGNEPHMLDLK